MEKRRSHRQDAKIIIVQVGINDLPEKVRSAMLRAIDRVKHPDLGQSQQCRPRGRGTAGTGSEGLHRADALCLGQRS